jgi:hypothetical protein
MNIVKLSCTKLFLNRDRENITESPCTHVAHMPPCCPCRRQSDAGLSCLVRYLLPEGNVQLHLQYAPCSPVPLTNDLDLSAESLVGSQLGSGGTMHNFGRPGSNAAPHMTIYLPTMHDVEGSVPRADERKMGGIQIHVFSRQSYWLQAQFHRAQKCRLLPATTGRPYLACVLDDTS